MDHIIAAAALGFLLWVILTAASVPHSWWVFGVALALFVFVIGRKEGMRVPEIVLGNAGAIGNYCLVFAPFALMKGEYKIAGVLAATGVVLLGFDF
jgi:hypothetical protein